MKTHLGSRPSSFALRQTFMPKKASQKFGAERKMALRPTFSLFEIDPWSVLQWAFYCPVKGSGNFALEFYDIVDLVSDPAVTFQQRCGRLSAHHPAMRSPRTVR